MVIKFLKSNSKISTKKIVYTLFEKRHNKKLQKLCTGLKSLPLIRYAGLSLTIKNPKEIYQVLKS